MTNDKSEMAYNLQREAAFVSNRLREISLNPIHGNFDTKHLKAIHAHIFQDLPHHRPGVTRGYTENWVKHRALEDSKVQYDVGYASDNVKERISIILEKFGGSQSLEGLSVHDAAERLAALYGDLDYAHGFYEGNSRTLREFTRELAAKAGFELDWVGTNANRDKRNDLYIARDIEVMNRAYPDLTEERAMQTDNRHEYETFFRLDTLRQLANGKTLASIIESSLMLEKEREEQHPAQERENEARQVQKGRAKDKERDAELER